MSPTFAEIQLESLKKDLEKLHRDYDGVADKKRRESNPQEQNNLQLQLDSIAKQIEEIQKKIKELEAKHENQKNQKLQEILSIFTKKEEISIVKQAYHACSPKGWHHLSTDKPEEILADVMTMRKGNSEYTKVEHFVACLIILVKNNRLLVSQLEEWAKYIGDEKIIDLLNQEKQNLEKRCKENTNSYLIVRVRESSKKDYYFVNAWFIRNGDKYNYKDNPDCQQLYEEKPNEDENQKSFLLEEVPDEINNFLHKIGSNASSKLTIEIFLPLNLMNKAVDSWEIKNEFGLEPEKLSSIYKVVVRSTERCENVYNRYWGHWEEKWNNLQNIIKQQAIGAFLFYNSDDSNELNSEIRKGNYIGIKLQKPPIKTGKGSVFAVFLNTAIPIALWLRYKLPPNCNEQVDTLLRCCINELIEKVAAKRREALPEHQDSHIGHHISLLWEDPYRLPPGTYEVISMPSN